MADALLLEDGNRLGLVATGGLLLGGIPPLTPGALLLVDGNRFGLLAGGALLFEVSASSSPHLTIHAGSVLFTPSISPHLTVHAGSVIGSLPFVPTSGEWPWFSPYEHADIVSLSVWLARGAVASDELAVQIWHLPADAVDSPAGTVPWTQKTSPLGAAAIVAGESTGTQVYEPALVVERNEGLRVDLIEAGATVPNGAELFVSIFMVVASVDPADQTTTHAWT